MVCVCVDVNNLIHCIVCSLSPSCFINKSKLVCYQKDACCGENQTILERQTVPPFPLLQFSSSSTCTPHVSSPSSPSPYSLSLTESVSPVFARHFHNSSLLWLDSHLCYVLCIFLSCYWCGFVSYLSVVPNVVWILFYYCHRLECVPDVFMCVSHLWVSILIKPFPQSQITS